GSAGIEKLNAAWGNVFWSMEYRSWAEIDLPNLTVTEANPAHWLDFWRFASDEVVSYNRLHVEIIRKHSPGRFVTHNFMGLFTEFDHFDVGQDLDFASWDSYPLGGTNESPALTEAEKIAYAATGHPDMAAIGHDAMRAVGRGRFWIMEQQPGPVNWASFNPAPKPGMVRLWSWEAFAHGAEVVSYFRWRQAPFAQEQMHAGLNRPDGKLDLGGEEAMRVARELEAVALEPPAQAPVALVFDYQAAWMLNIQPQGADYRYTEMVFRWYEGVRSLGLDVDFVRPGADLRGYKLVVVPSLPLVTERAAEAFAAADGLVLFAPRCGSKVEGFQIPPELPPGPLKGLLPLTVWRVESLRPGTGQAVSGAAEGMVERWREHVETDLKPLSLFADGSGALYRHGRAFYMAGWPDRALLDGTLRMLADEAGLPALRLPEGIRLRRRGGLAFAFNFGASAQSLPVPHGTRFVLGGPQLAPQDVAAWRV
ncbi:MAG TPA: beta-galactosidase, partial [Alphaproteobacteria bacterium]|nr:beta-galactosidase [Alphaproteobacteria bacterium]